MLTTASKQAAFAFGLDRKQSARVLEQALRSGAMVTLTPKNDEPARFYGPIERATAESLWIGFCSEGPKPALPTLSVCCEGVLELGDARYLFDTNVLGISEELDTPLVEVATPQCLRVIQRRRFWRAKLQQSTTVRLCGFSSADSDQGAGWQISAVLMNVSADGMACRVERSGADAAGVGQVIQVVFQFCAHEEPFVIDALVKSKIPAGTKDQMIVGLQFKFAPGDPQQSRLQVALEQFS